MLRVLFLEIYMFTGVSKILIIATMLIAFVGQAIAFNTSTPCESPSDSHFDSTSKLEENHDVNPNNIDSAEDCCGIECCNVDCVCFANACSSFVYFSTETFSLSLIALSDQVYKQQSEQTNIITTLLYRPPIFTS